MLFFDTTYLIMVFIPALLLSLGAQFYLSSTYRKWGDTRNARGLTGAQAGQIIAQKAGLGVRFEGVQGRLSDHYDPSSHTVRMSQDIATKPSVAALAIVAHELGHAQQHQEKSPLIALRSFLVPAMAISPNVAMGLVFAGLIFSATGLIWIGILFYLVVVAFMILTLPVEIDASRRGLVLLQQADLTTSSAETSGARAVLTAAAMTYVAAAVQAILQLLYFIQLARRN